MYKKNINNIQENFIYITENACKLGKYIRELRLIQKWSTAKLSELTGLSVGFINQLENGKCKNPKVTTLSKLEKVFELEYNTLYNFINYSFVITKEKKDWKLSITNELYEIGLKDKYINEVIEYIETVKIKQEIKENNKE